MHKIILSDQDPPALTVHKNTPHCPSIFEVIPVHGCEFGCDYCNVYGLDQVNQDKPIIVFKKYPQLLEKHLESHRAELSKILYYFSPKTDCFQKVLLDSGITESIIDLLAKYKARYLIVTKGTLADNPRLFKKIVQTKDRAQMLSSYGMPDEAVREAIEPGAATLQERFDFAKQCKVNGLQTVGILEPLLPLQDISYVYRIMDRFKEIGVDYFAIDFLRISPYTIDRLVEKLPSLAEEIRNAFNSEDARQERFNTGPLKEREIIRLAPSRQYLVDKFEEIKKYATSIGATVSVCGVFNLDGFNKEAGEKGYICMGIQTRM